MGHIFVSYAREDHAFVDALVAELQKADLDVWVDRHREAELIGKKWQEGILPAIKACAAFLLVLSPRSARSKEVPRELAVADQAGKSIVVVVQEQTNLPPDMEHRLIDVSN